MAENSESNSAVEFNIRGSCFEKAKGLLVCTPLSSNPSIVHYVFHVVKDWHGLPVLYIAIKVTQRKVSKKIGKTLSIPKSDTTDHGSELEATSPAEIDV